MQKTLTIFLTLFLSYTSVYAHSGGTDANGGHTNRKTGEYHYHNKKEVKKPTTPPKKSERDYQQEWCKLQHGQIEYVLPDKTRVDCLTELYAIEFEFASNWTEAIGQSLYYASMTDKKPGIVLIYEKDTDSKYLDRINKVIEENNLSIRIWELNKRLDNNVGKE